MILNGFKQNAQALCKSSQVLGSPFWVTLVYRHLQI